MACRLLLIGPDHRHVNSLKNLCQRRSAFRVEGTATSWVEAQHWLRRHTCDCVVVAATFDLLAPIDTDVTQIPLVIIPLGQEDDKLLRRAHRLGAVVPLQGQGNSRGFEADLARVIERERNRSNSSFDKIKAEAMSKSIDLIAIGASTGGTDAIGTVIADINSRLPPVVVCQHMVSGYSKHFASGLNRRVDLPVSEVMDGSVLQAGQVYIAPSDQHLLVKRGHDGYVARLEGGYLCNDHCPSVDVLFRSIAQLRHAHPLAVLLTGMGKDGAEGLLRLREHGAPTLVQDEASSTVHGMPGAAIALGAAQHVLPLNQIARSINIAARGKVAQELERRA